MPGIDPPTEYGSVIVASIPGRDKPIVMVRTGEGSVPWVGWDHQLGSSNAWSEAWISSWRLWTPPNRLEITEDEIRDAVLDASGFPLEDDDVRALKELFESKDVSKLAGQAEVQVSLKAMAKTVEVKGFEDWWRS
jgi:hypothetical protein